MRARFAARSDLQRDWRPRLRRAWAVASVWRCQLRAVLRPRLPEAEDEVRGALEVPEHRAERSRLQSRGLLIPEAVSDQDGVLVCLASDLRPLSLVLPLEPCSCFL